MIGTTLAHYEVTSELGKGGMGEVYQATDTKLGRQVAIKTLPEEFAKDEERLARFEREAKLLASLNHPNIAAIYGLEEQDSTRFLVLELVEGDTLADRLKRGAIPVEESLKLALQIAEALEAAHEKGVIHRDLKPGNIKVTPDGKVKVLDFGLAKALVGDGSEVNLSNSPTLSRTATEQGVILGTAAYMSPEQTRGRVVDKRADVWAFGCVLFEMLTGRRSFPGDDVTDILAAVIRAEPAWTALPANLHPKVRELLERCLEKEATNRWQAIGDVRVDIQKVLSDPGSRHGTADGTGGLASVGPWKRLSVALAAVAALLALGWAVQSVLRPMERPVSRYSIALPVTQRADGFGSNIAVSPDGTQMVYVGQGEQGLQLWLRRRDQLQATPIAGTEGAANPVFSPDGQRVAFRVGGGAGGVSAVSLSGEPPLAIVESGAGRAGLAWGPDGYVYFKAPGNSALLRVPETSGEVEPFTVLDTAQSETGHFWPQALPNGRGVLFTLAHQPGNDVSQYDIAVADLETGEHEVLLGGVFARYAASGHLVYVAADGTLLAAPFDQDALQLAGDTVALTEGVGVRRNGAVHLALSEEGTLVYRAGEGFGGAAPDRIPALVDRSGVVVPLNVRPAPYVSPRLSPDGTQLAVQTLEDDGQSIVWVYDLSGDTAIRRVTQEGNNSRPIWTPDGERLTFASDRDGPTSIYWQPADGSGVAERLTTAEEGTSHLPESWSPDGNVLSFAVERGGDYGIWTLSLDGGATPEVFYDLPESIEYGSLFSPDGKWLAYFYSEQVGTRQVYVQPFPATGAIHQLTQEGGVFPLWSRDGSELFYRRQVAAGGVGRVNAGARIAGVAVSTDGAFGFGNEQTLPIEGFLVVGTYRDYDITPDGQRFLLAFPAEQTEADEPARQQTNVILNFFEELKERVPVP